MIFDCAMTKYWVDRTTRWFDARLAKASE